MSKKPLTGYRLAEHWHWSLTNRRKNKKATSEKKN